MEILKFLGIDVNEQPDVSIVSPVEQQQVEIQDGKLHSLLVTDISLPKGARSTKEGLVVSFLILKELDGREYITGIPNDIQFPYGKKGLYVSHKVTPDLFDKMNYIIRVSNRSHTVKLPDDFETYDDAKAGRFFLTVVSFRFGLDRYIAKGMVIPSYIYVNNRGFRDVSIFDRNTRTYLPTPLPYEWIGKNQTESELITDDIVRLYWSNSKSDSDLSEGLRKVLGL